MVIGIALASQLQNVASNWLRTYVGERLVREFRGRIFRNLQRMSLLYHDVKGTMDSIYRVQYDSAAIQYIAIDGVIPFVTATLTFASMLLVSFSIDWQLALVALGVSPFLFAVARAYRTAAAGGLPAVEGARELRVLGGAGGARRAAGGEGVRRRGTRAGALPRTLGTQRESAAAALRSARACSA